VPSPLLSRRLWLAALPGFSLAACASDPAPAPAPVAAAPPPPAEPPLGAAVARVEIIKWQVGFIGLVHWSDGVLTYQGRRHRFRARGLGAGGVGMARVRATGEVYNMTSLMQFPGIFGQVQTGLVAPGAQMRGTLWMRNTSGVRLCLPPNHTGLAAQLGADGILIEMI